MHLQAVFGLGLAGYLLAESECTLSAASDKAIRTR